VLLELKIPKFDATDRRHDTKCGMEFTQMHIAMYRTISGPSAILRSCTCQLRHSHGRHVPVTDNPVTVQNFQPDVSHFLSTCSTQHFRSAASNAPVSLLITGCSLRSNKATSVPLSICPHSVHPTVVQHQRPNLLSDIHKLRHNNSLKKCWSKPVFCENQPSDTLYCT
jgi:hypothetical protein